MRTTKTLKLMLTGGLLAAMVAAGGCNNGGGDVAKPVTIPSTTQVARGVCAMVNGTAMADYLRLNNVLKTSLEGDTKCVYKTENGTAVTVDVQNGNSAYDSAIGVAGTLANKDPYKWDEARRTLAVSTHGRSITLVLGDSAPTATLDTAKQVVESMISANGG